MRAWHLTLALLAGSTGCGYQMGFGLAEPGLRTIAVQVAGNETFRQTFEAPLTRELNRSLPVHTGYRIGRAGKADAVLEVTIVDLRNNPLVAGAGVPVLEGSLDTSARFRLVSRRTGAVLLERTIRDVAEYRTNLGESEASARQELVFDMARKIVLALEGDF